MAREGVFIKISWKVACGLMPIRADERAEVSALRSQRQIRIVKKS
jgi:hypothetical protein